MPQDRVRAVCGSCRRRARCPDAATLEILRTFLENSHLAAELELANAKRYRLGCERYRPDRREVRQTAPPLRLVARNDEVLPCA